MRYYILILSFITTCITANAFASENITIAVLHFKASDVPQYMGKGVRDIAEVSFYKSGYFAIIEQNEINSIMKERKILSRNCDSLDCANKIGKIIAADYIVMGTIEKPDDYRLTIQYIETKKGTLFYSDSEMSPSGGNLTSAIEKLVTRSSYNLIKKHKKMLRNIYQKSFWYIGFGIGSGYIWSNPPYSFFSQDTLDFIYSLYFTTGKIFHKKIHVGLDLSIISQFNNKEGEASESTDPVDYFRMITNLFCAVSYYPLSKGFFIKGGTGMSIYSGHAESPNNVSDYKIFTGLGIVAGVGYAFWIRDGFHISLNVDYSHQFYFGIASIEQSYFINGYVSFCWF